MFPGYISTSLFDLLNIKTDHLVLQLFLMLRYIDLYCEINAFLSMGKFNSTTAQIDLKALSAIN